MILQSNTGFELIWLIIAFLAATFLIAIFSAIYLQRRRKRHAKVYPLLMKTFKEALENENIDSIIDSSDKLIWNENFSINDREYVYNELNSRIKSSPELRQSWEYAHFKRFGTYPE
jgi:flagellar biosynthesis/type III secretory pathway M-ring protein FliF/YscJ